MSIKWGFGDYIREADTSVWLIYSLVQINIIFQNSSFQNFFSNKLEIGTVQFNSGLIPGWNLPLTSTCYLTV